MLFISHHFECMHLSLCTVPFQLVSSMSYLGTDTCLWFESRQASSRCRGIQVMLLRVHRETVWSHVVRNSFICAVWVCLKWSIIVRLQYMCVQIQKPGTQMGIRPLHSHHNEGILLLDAINKWTAKHTHTHKFDNAQWMRITITHIDTQMVGLLLNITL